MDEFDETTVDSPVDDYEGSDSDGDNFSEDAFDDSVADDDIDSGDSFGDDFSDDEQEEVDGDDIIDSGDIDDSDTSDEDGVESDDIDGDGLESDDIEDEIIDNGYTYDSSEEYLNSTTYGHGDEKLETSDPYASYSESHFSETDDRYMDEEAEMTEKTNLQAQRELDELNRIQEEEEEEEEEESESDYDPMDGLDLTH